MHNNIMAAGSRDRPPMLATRRYAQWQSRQPATVESPKVPERTTFETFSNISPENKAHYDAEKEAIHLLLTGIKDEIYSTVEACKTAHDIFTSRDRESIESYYSRFYKMMNEMVKNQLEVATIHKGKEIAKPITPPPESASEEESDPEQAQRDKDINKNVDTNPRYVNENQSGQFGNQRTVTITKARETVGSQVVQQTGIQCFICKEFGHFSKECRKPKWVKDYTYHKEKMLICKQAKKGVPLEDTDEEIDEQEFEAHYMYMAKIQEVQTTDSEPSFYSEPLEEVHSNDDYNVFANKRQHSEQPKSINDTHVVEKDDHNVILDSSNMCDHDNQAD
ncbi:integrase, catalytic region, zinc finger, CCHC-type containing protein [Tanacetum coccineum]